MRLEADQQRKEGDIYFADGNVEIQYKNMRLRADHVQYNTKTYMAIASGHVLFDVDTQHLTADSAEFNVQTGDGPLRACARRSHDGAAAQRQRAGFAESADL